VSGKKKGAPKVPQQKDFMDHVRINSGKPGSTKRGNEKWGLEKQAKGIKKKRKLNTEKTICPTLDQENQAHEKRNTPQWQQSTQRKEAPCEDP